MAKVAIGSSGTPLRERLEHGKLTEAEQKAAPADEGARPVHQAETGVSGPGYAGDEGEIARAKVLHELHLMDVQAEEREREKEKEAARKPGSERIN